MVQEILELEEQTPKNFENYYILKKGAFDFFGNFIKQSYKLTLILKIRDTSKPSRHKVIMPIFRRGYKDKGSLRLPHENHGDQSQKEIERIDLRQKVKHPLLEKYLADEDDVNKTLPERSKIL
jgi:hypothetical protein